jgi:hypothetical protein
MKTSATIEIPKNRYARVKQYITARKPLESKAVPETITGL